MRTIVDRTPKTVDECQYAFVITTPEFTLETRNDYIHCGLRRVTNDIYGDCDLCKGEPCRELIGIVGAAMQHGIDV